MTYTVAEPRSISPSENGTTRLREPSSKYVDRRQMTLLVEPPNAARLENNKLATGDRAVHDWYRFVLSFPPHLVREYFDRFELGGGQTVLDPFCGTGTTLVEAKKLGIASVGVEGNPMAYVAARVKVDWTPDPDALIEHARLIARDAHEKLQTCGLSDECGPGLGTAGLRALSSEQTKLLLKDSISPLPLHKAIVLLEELRSAASPEFEDHELLAFARSVVLKSSNLAFGPEVGLGRIKSDAEVVRPWLDAVHEMADDLRLFGQSDTSSRVIFGDARELEGLIPPNSIDAVFTSPPYPNEKDYTRTTRLESVLLGLIPDKAALRTLKRGLVRSNTRGAYKTDDDDQWVTDFPEIQRIAREIEERRRALNKTSGFERMYHRVAKLYFGGMSRHFASLRPLLKPGALLAYVVGDQASYLRVMIRTGQLLAEIAQSLGYEVVGIDLFRTRLATATREHLREEVVVLRWPG